MKDYVSIAKELGKLLEEKQAAYGDSFSRSKQIINILYPDGILPDKYQDALTIIRIIDKLFRIANKKHAFGESPYKDIAGYALLGLANDMEEKT